MSQRRFLRQFDAAAFAAFGAAGLGDKARYVDADGVEHGCDVLVDRSAEGFGDEPRQGIVQSVRITLQRAQVPAEANRRGRHLQLLEGDVVVETFALDEPHQLDESSECWWVVPA